MFKDTIKIITNFAKILFLSLQKIFSKIDFTSKIGHLLSFFRSWSHLLGTLLFCFIILYYPIGGYLVNKIDKTTDYELNISPQQSQTIEMMSFLIKREVNDHLWTPNLPFIFPSYFLDNMPAFQMGLMNAISRTTFVFAKRQPSASKESLNTLKKASEHLRYSGTIWMFSPQNHLTPAPSANSQYRKAARFLDEYNQALADGEYLFYKNSDDLAALTQSITDNLWRGVLSLENHIREHSSDWFDFRSDSVFYYNQGKAYAYVLLLKTLGNDYKEQILAHELYEDWTRAIKYLEDATLLNPSLIRNGTLDSSVHPNSLVTLSYYLTKAAFITQRITDKLEKSSKGYTHAN